MAAAMGKVFSAKYRSAATTSMNGPVVPNA
jgi:hypothetical protein